MPVTVSGTVGINIDGGSTFSATAATGAVTPANQVTVLEEKVETLIAEGMKPYWAPFWPAVGSR